MKATTLLERQLRSLQQLCEAIERGSASVRESLLPQLATDLAAHIAVEDAVFYPAVRDAIHEEAALRRGRARHAQARSSLERALDSSVDGDEFSGAIADLRALIQLHVDEEEELLFPRLESALDARTMRELAIAMLSLYHTRVEAGYTRGAPIPDSPSSSSSGLLGSGRSP